MSDFLNKFSKNEYADNKEIKEPEDEQKVNHRELQKKPLNSSSTPPRRNVETYEKDTSYGKKKKIKIGIGIGATLVVLITIISIFVAMNTITMGQFKKTKTIEDMRVWALQNKITLNETFEYSKEAEENHEIEQSVPADKKISKGSAVDVKVSKGADPEEKIPLPDFATMNGTQIEEWKDKNKATNVTISKEFSDDIEKNKFIKTEFKDKDIVPEDYRRKNKITVSVSKGKEVFEKNIEVPDFEDKTKIDVKTWAEKEGVVVEFLEQADDEIDKGGVIAQNIAPKEKIAKKDKIKVTISLGKVMYAPSFYGLDETAAQILASSKGINANVLHSYHNEVAASQLISQSIPAGGKVQESFFLTYSLGKPFMGNFDDQPVSTLLDLINEMNQKGANISYFINYVNGNGAPKGNVISTSVNSSFIDTGSTLNIDVSNGN